MLLASSQPPSLHSPSGFLASKKLSVAKSSVAPSRVRYSYSAVFNSAARAGPSSLFSHMAASPGSFYEVLGIPMGATCQEIKTAYRRLARACHPDVVAMERKETSADEFMKIHAAYATLLDPQKRVDYDRTLFRRKPRFSTSQYTATSASSSTMSSFSGYASRTWETDQCW